MNKYYSKDAPPHDPLLRCDSCARIVRAKELRKLGMCEFCGNRKVRNVLIMTPEEMEQAKAWEIDPDFLALFGEVQT